MSRKALLTVLLIFVGFSLSAQGLYKEGFVLKSPLDTLHGQIRYISYNQAAKRCVLLDTNGQHQEFLPQDIYGYGIGSELLFHSKSLPGASALFAEVLYQGSVTLYTYRDTYQRNFFYLENPTLGELRALTEKVIERGNRRQTVKSYVDVLKIMLPEHELIDEEIEGTSLSAKSLNDLLIAYDELVAGNRGISYIGPHKKSPKQFGILAGLMASGLKVNGHSGGANAQGILLGLRAQKEVSRNTGRLFLHADLVVTNERYTHTFEGNHLIRGNNDVVTNSLNITRRAGGLSGRVDYLTRVELDRTLMQLPVGLKYKLPGEKFNVTFGGGFEFQYATTKEVLVDGQVLQNGQVLAAVRSQEDTNPFRYGVYIVMGLSYNAQRTLFLDLRHSPIFFDQGGLNYSYTRLLFGVMLEKGN